MVGLVAAISIPAVGSCPRRRAGCRGVGGHRASGGMRAEGEGMGPAGGRGLGARTFFRGTAPPGFSLERKQAR